MGYVLAPEELTDAAGEYSAEVRGESFSLRGEPNWVWWRVVGGVSEVGGDGFRPDGDGWECKYVERHHAIYVYENGDSGQGTVEIPLEDIQKIRAVLDAVERHVIARKSDRPW